MSRPTTLMSPAKPSIDATGVYPKRLILTETSRLCAQILNGRLRAIVLTGSVARDEGSFIRHLDGHVLLGDIEFFLVFEDAEPLPSNGVIALVASKLEERYRQVR